MKYGERVDLSPSLWFELKDAGHLLGSASARVHCITPSGEKTIVFSGDIGNTDQPIIRDPDYFREASFVVMESTYGDRLHKAESRNEGEVLLERAKRLAEITDSTFKRGGNLVIPSFAVGRTQEILYLYRIIQDRKLLPYEIPVFVDSPLSVKATRVFSSCLRGDYFDKEAITMIERGINPILFPSLVTITDVEESKALNERRESAVIISSSGMCEAGRIRHHLKHNLWRRESTILFVGYQAEGTLGRSLVDGADLTLPIGQAQGIVKGTHGDAETRHGIAVGVEHGLKAPLLEIRVHVLDDRVVGKGLHKLAAPRAQLTYVVPLQRVLVLASGRTASHLQVLGRLQKNLNTRLTHKSWP